MTMKYIYNILLMCAMTVFCYSCESADDISKESDHEVPQYEVLTDYLEVPRGQSVTLKVNVSDNEGLSQMVFSYGSWAISEKIYVENNAKSYSFERTIEVPADAAIEWNESLIENDGTEVPFIQKYHKLTLTVTDINMNVRVIPIHISVK